MPKTPKKTEGAARPTVAKLREEAAAALLSDKSRDTELCGFLNAIATQLNDQLCKARHFTIQGQAACPDGCTRADLPRLRPCFRVRWGDGPQDRIETEDVENVCITACNPYSNVRFKNVRLVISLVVDTNGQIPPTLPDGTPSVELKPSTFICFGDLGPCEGKALTCASREAVLLTRGAKAGGYVLYAGICFEACWDGDHIEAFRFELVAS